MNERWDLTPIYKGFDDEAFARDFQALKEKVSQMADFAGKLENTEALAGLKQGIELLEAISSLGYKLAGYASLCQAADTKDPEAGSQMGCIMAVYSDCAAPEAAFKAWAAKLPDLMALVESDEVLKDYSFLFRNIADSSRYLLAGRGEEIMAKMDMSGSSAWSEMQ